jgi:phosphoribosylformimino-5-aminoimidazole carboxamide ribotide isomerase
MLIIPAIDIYQGKCVRLNRGQFGTQTVYSDSSVRVAQSFREAGFSFLHIIDLDGAERGQVTNWDSLEKILAVSGVQAEVGGGVRSKQEVSRLLQLGAHRVILGSVAVSSPSRVKEWIATFGADRIAIALDIRNGNIAYGGWVEQSKDAPTKMLSDMTNAGARTVICTDIERDGMLQGPNVNLYKEIRSRFQTVELLASGGIASTRDIQALATIGVSGAIVGKAIYEGRVTLEELRAFMKEQTVH